MLKAAKKFLWRCLPFWARPSYILARRRKLVKLREFKAAHLKKEPRCVACGRSENVFVHHIIPVAVNPAREFDPDNLITLCASRCLIVFGHLMCYHCYNPDVRKMAEEYCCKVKKRSCHISF